jgi:glycyl-tRNA synthetase beta chain
MGKEFLLEIGTEEIPAGMLDFAVKDLQRVAEEYFDKNEIGFSGVKVYGTPRRLVLYVKSLMEAQEDKVIEKRGPAKSVAYDKDGNPTKAAIGFAKGQGVDVSDICVIKTDKGEYICVRKTRAGRKTKEVLSEILPQTILNIPFKKSMRWSDITIRFVRPIHWILALFGGQVIDFSVGNIKSGNLSCGHRFLSPSKFAVKDFKNYKNELKKRYVLVEADKRKEVIAKDISNIEKRTGLELIKDDELLDHVANLVEYPVTVNGKFDEKFLKLPKEVLINSMKEHQKYFAMSKKNKNKSEITNSFINVINTKPKNLNVVIKGNERVLRARLSDAEFFFNEDKKKKLSLYNEQLKGVIFQNKLGTIYEKVERVVENAKFIAGAILPEKVEKAARAAYLCKADLVTEMVGEFPKLQGIMGRKYAVLSGEGEEVAQAVYEHYLPTGADGTLPETDVGAVVSIADKIDTIAACFSVGLVPTGAADPFALRRQTLGIINILLDKKYTISLRELIKKAYDNIKEKATRKEGETVEDVLNFFEVRFKNAFAFSYDVVNAVLALRLDKIIESYKKAQALNEFKKRPDFESIAISFKRVANIVKGVDKKENADTSLFKHTSENALYDKFNEVKESVIRLCADYKYYEALEEITKLKGPVDKFFDDVLVMTDDETLKNNRLALLQNIQIVFINIADFSKIS